MPYLGVGAVRNDFIDKNPQAVSALIVAIHDAIAWGSAHPQQVASILQKAANLPESDAKIYAAHWSELNSLSLEPVDIDTLKREHEIFVDSGAIKGALPADVFAAGPYQTATAAIAARKP